MSARWLKHGLYYALASCLLLEALLRIVGYRPYEHTPFSVTSSPPLAYRGDATLGIQLNEGVFDITVNETLKFRATHEFEGHRKVSDLRHDSPPEVLMLGCSYTYGYGVNDEEPFTAILQQRYPEVHFKNAAVIGHGTVQALIKLRWALAQYRPKLVILNLSSYHLMRNTLSQQYRSHLKIGYRRASPEAQQQMASANFPFLTSCQDSIRWVAWDQLYDNWPGRETLALVNATQTSYDHIRDQMKDPVKVTSCLLKEMARLCRDHGVSFQVACLDSSPATDNLQTQDPDVPWIEVGFSFSDTTLTNYPYDDHPSPAGHQFIADRIDQHLSSDFHQMESSSHEQKGEK